MNGGRLTAALILLLVLDWIHTSEPSSAPSRYAIAIPDIPKLGDGAPLVT